MFKSFFKLTLPPILVLVIAYVWNFKKRKYKENPDTLFDGDDSLFKNEVKSAIVYGEYGCGKSTKWVLNNTSSQVIVVDTSSDWIAEVKNDNRKNNARLNIHYSDLGELKEWGRPASYLKHNNFSDYTDYIWSQKDKPDVILVDGRFRVCCFLTSLKFAKEGTKIIFDDYTNRAYYHFVEKYVPRIKECGRQCLFIVPPKSSIDMAELNKDIEKFRYVME
jgi:hypothetical protein